MITPSTQEETSLESTPGKLNSETSPRFANESAVASGELAQCLGCPYDAVKQLETDLCPKIQAQLPGR